MFDQNINNLIHVGKTKLFNVVTSNSFGSEMIFMLFVYVAMNL